jgi:hypothetical protein
MEWMTTRRFVACEFTIVTRNVSRDCDFGFNSRNCDVGFTYCRTLLDFLWGCTRLLAVIVVVGNNNFLSRYD